MMFLRALLTFAFLHSVHGQSKTANVEIHKTEEGNLDIKATPVLAMVTATADSMQMIVDPGTEKLSKNEAEKQTKDLMHVGEANSVAVDKRSKLGKAIAVVNPKKMVSNEDKEKAQKLQKQKKKTHSFAHWLMEQYRAQKSKRIKQPKDLKKNKRKLMSPSRKMKDENPNKKSLIDKEMHVSGSSGKLRINANLNKTTVDSEGGELNVYIKNPVKSSTKGEKKATISPENDSGLHIIDDVAGLKKSLIKGVQDLKQVKKSLTSEARDVKEVAGDVLKLITPKV